MPATRQPRSRVRVPERVLHHASARRGGLGPKPNASTGRSTPGHRVANAEVARLFREMADLLEIEGSNAFRVRAYRNAARVVEELPEPVAALVESDGARLTNLPGVGEDLAGKIVEIVRSGSFDALRSAERGAPPGAVELMQVPGLGPKRARVISETLGVRSVAGLARAAKAGRLRELPGFGAALEKKLLQELESRPGGEQRMLRARAAQYGEQILDYVRAIPGVLRADLAGSYRRAKDTVGDLDLLVTCERGAPVADLFTAYDDVREVIAHGTTRSAVRLTSGLQVDLRVLDAECYGAGLHYFTGSKAHNIAVRRLAQQRGLKLNEYGVFRGRRRIAGRDEQEVFASVGLPWIPPELREDRGELEAAKAGTLPSLLELTDIRGDLQMHTTSSDGRDTLEAMAEGAQALGYSYIAITDHSPSVRIAGGLDRAGFRRQRRSIDRLNARLHGLTVLVGAEVDILEDGSLDLDNETLNALDIVVVSLHSKLDLPGPRQTERVLRGLQHPAVDVLGHPTGRLLGRRRGATLDLERVIRAAIDHGVLLEVNAQPERLDLDDIGCRAAIDAGARIVVNTDAHSVDELRHMRWGVDQARRGWARKVDVANTRPLSRLLPLLHGHRHR